ncbi:MAG: Bug family tripartite tricarboxylate transporter substrate binding protein [Lautropia sp.]
MLARSRRAFLKQSLAVAPVIASPRVLAQPAWPSRAVKLMVSFAPGGSSDVVARALSPLLYERLGQPFVVENRPGAGGMIAAQQLKRESPDGHAFIISNNAPFTLVPTLYKNPGYDPIKDFTHLGYLGTIYGGCITNPKTGLNNLRDLVARAKADPGKLTFGSSGIGSVGHIVGETFKRMAGIDILHVAYKGAALLRQDLAAGVVDLQFEGLLGNLPLLQSGALRALGSASPERQAPAPDVPTFREQGYDITVEFWHGLSAPAGLPPEIGDRMERVLAELMQRREVLDRIGNYGIFYQPMTRAAFNKLVVDQVELWRPWIVAAGVAGQQ